MTIKKNDIVKVIAGKDKGKTGKIIAVFPDTNRVIVENINFVKKAQRKTQVNPQGGLIDIEAPVHRSNVMLIDKKTNKPSRYGVRILKDGTKTRISKKSGEDI
ncbi:MAG: 50S ribosomal protein L24 [Candidatus Omnitrophica bacterium]|nr:50S ribosomal protein L24 [Candidatus Omnitrophota bacterium]